MDTSLAKSVIQCQELIPGHQSTLILQNRHVQFVEDAKLEEINDAMSRKKVFRRSTGFLSMTADPKPA